MTVTLRAPGPDGLSERKVRSVHQVVMIAFAANQRAPGHHTVDHVNRNRADNSLP